MRLIGSFAGILWAVVAPHAFAQDINPCLYDLPCIGGGFSGLAAFLDSAVVPYAELVFFIISVFAFFYYAMRLVTESREDENVMKESRSGFTHLIHAAAIVGISVVFVNTFGSSASQTLINPGPFNSALGLVAFFFRILVGTVLTAVIVAQGFLIIISSEEGEVTKHRTRLLHAVIGVIIIALTNSLVAALQPGTGSTILASETQGIANYLLVLFIVLAVVACIVAGAMYILSVDESLKDKAKGIIKTAIVSVIIVLCSYVIVFFFITI